MATTANDNNKNDNGANKTTTAAARPPAPAKKGGGGGWFWLLLVVVIAAGGGGAYLANTPTAQMIAEKLGFRVVAYTKTAPDDIDNIDNIGNIDNNGDAKTPPLPQAARESMLPPDLHAPSVSYQPAAKPAADLRQDDNAARQNDNVNNADNVDNVNNADDIVNVANADNVDNVADDGGAGYIDNAAPVDIAAELASINRRMDLNDDNNAKRWRQVQSRLYQLEQRAATGNNAQQSNRQSIQLIDIALRTTGDAAAAADALEYLAANAETEQMRQFLLAEARRLGDAPNRRQITAAIGKLRGLLVELGDIRTDEKPGNAALAMVFSLLKVQKITTAKSRAKGLDDALAKMEWLLIVGRDGEYLRELDAAADKWQSAKDKNDNGDIARLFGELRRMGAPRYQLEAGQ